MRITPVCVAGSLAVSAWLFPVRTEAGATFVAFDYSSGGSLVIAGPSMVGWTFTLATEMEVTSLGWYDPGQDGLGNSHQVAIWDTGGTLKLSGIVPVGVTGDLVDGFRYTDALTGSATLSPGNYVIAGLGSTSDQSLFQIPVGNLTMGPGVTFGNARQAGGSFTMPVSNVPGFNAGLLGPNFQYTATAVPEPGTYGLLAGLGLLGFGAWLRRGRKTA